MQNCILKWNWFVAVQSYAVWPLSHLPHMRLSHLATNETGAAGHSTTVAFLFLDDNLVPGRTFRQQLDSLQIVFQRLNEAKILRSATFSRKKSSTWTMWWMTECLQTQRKWKLFSYLAWPKSRPGKDIRSILRLASYYGCFIAAPLYQCSRKTTTFVWSTEAVSAFIKLKTALSNALVLAYPDPALPILLDTDASNVGIEAVQVLEGRDQ